MKIDCLRVALLLLLLYAALPVVSSYSQSLLYIAIPGSALLSFWGSYDRSQSIYMKSIGILFLWVAITSLFAYDFNISFTWLRRIVAVYLLCYAVHLLAKNGKYIPWIYLIWGTMYITCLIYAQNIVLTTQFDYTSGRMTDSNLNANTLGYFTFFFTFILYYWGNYNSKWQSYLRLAFWITIPLTFYIALITASRQIFIIQFPLIAVLLYLRYLKGATPTKRFFFILAITTIVVLFVSDAMNIYNSSFLAHRSQIDIDEDIRTKLINDGVQTGFDNIITGVGIGCFGYYNYGHDTFSHNTYVEIFATTGIIGCFIYIFMLLHFIITQLKRYWKYRETDYLLFSFIGAIYALDNMFFVFYTDPWLMSFFIMLTCHAEFTFQRNMSKFN